MLRPSYSSFSHPDSSLSVTICYFGFIGYDLVVSPVGQCPGFFSILHLGGRTNTLETLRFNLMTRFLLKLSLCLAWHAQQTVIRRCISVASFCLRRSSAVSGTHSCMCGLSACVWHTSSWVFSSWYTCLPTDYGIIFRKIKVKRPTLIWYNRYV